MKQLLYITITVTVLVLFVTGLVSTPVAAQDKSTYIPLLGEKRGVVRKTVKSEKKDETPKDYHPIVVLAGGCFFAPIGDMNDVLAPGVFSGKAQFQYLRAPHKLTGFAFDLSASYLKDRDFDGGVLYFSSIPYFALTFTPLNNFDFQWKIGGGITWVRTDIDKGMQVVNNSVDLTFSTGFMVMYTFLDQYVVGLETVFNYYFERKSSGAVGVNFMMGYRI